MLTVGTSYTFCVEATDTDLILTDLTYTFTVTPEGGVPVVYGMGTNNCYVFEPSCSEIGTYTISVEVSDGCEPPTPWGPITVNVCPDDPYLKIAIDDSNPCSGTCATITSVEWRDGDCLIETFVPPYGDYSPDLSWDVGSGLDFDPLNGTVCLKGTRARVPNGVEEDEIKFTYTDHCGGEATGTATVNFKLCCPTLKSLTLDITTPEPLCQDGCATINSATVTYDDDTTLLITDLTELTWSYNPAEIDFTPGTGAVCLADSADPGTYTINATYEDECKELVSSLEVGNITFEEKAAVTISANYRYAYRNCGQDLLFWWNDCGAGNPDRDHLPIIVTIVEGSKNLDNGTITINIDTDKLAVLTGPTPDGSGNIVLTINSAGDGVVEELIVIKAGALGDPGTQDWTDTTNITVVELKDNPGASTCFTSNILTIDGDNGPIDGDV